MSEYVERSWIPSDGPRRQEIEMICLDCGHRFGQPCELEYGMLCPVGNEECPECDSGDIVETRDGMIRARLTEAQRGKIEKLEEAGVTMTVKRDGQQISADKFFDGAVVVVIIIAALYFFGYHGLRFFLGN